MAKKIKSAYSLKETGTTPSEDLQRAFGDIEHERSSPAKNIVERKRNEEFQAGALECFEHVQGLLAQFVLREDITQEQKEVLGEVISEISMMYLKRY